MPQGPNFPAVPAVDQDALRLSLLQTHLPPGQGPADPRVHAHQHPLSRLLQAEPLTVVRRQLHPAVARAGEDPEAHRGAVDKASEQVHPVHLQLERYYLFLLGQNPQGISLQPRPVTSFSHINSIYLY